MAFSVSSETNPTSRQESESGGEVRLRLRAAAADLQRIVGRDHVVLSADAVEMRSRDIIPRVEAPAAFVYPGSLEEVVDLVKVS